MKHALKAAAAATALMMATPALADVTLFTDPGSLQPSENVLAEPNQSGTTIIGTTNQTQTTVLFRSLTCTSPSACTAPGTGETLMTQSSAGQARFMSADGSLDSLMISLAGGQTFLEFEFNLFNGFLRVRRSPSLEPQAD